MNYCISVSSLERLALIRTVVTLWNQDDIRDLLANYNFHEQEPLFGDEILRNWKDLEDKVIEKVSQFPLPMHLKQKISGFIRPIGLQILQWVHHHKESSYLGVNLPDEFCWTSQGTVDEKKTAEALLKDDNLDICTRYKLACIYCLEEDIPELWKKMPGRDSFCVENKKEFLIKFALGRNDSRESYQVKLVEHWINDMMRFPELIVGEAEESASTGKFEDAVIVGNKAAIGYFMKKLTAEEKEQCLVNYTGDVVQRHGLYRATMSDNRAEILCFLLSQMNEEQQTKMYRNWAHSVLCCFLDWPCQEFFMETAKRSWDFLEGENFLFILHEILRKATDGYKDYNYQNLFGEFWRGSPVNHKKFVTAKYERISMLVHQLCLIQDDENIKLITEDAERKELFFAAIRDFAKR